MSATTSIAPIGATKCRKLISPEMFDARTTMPTATKDPYLVYKITFLQIVLFWAKV